MPVVYPQAGGLFRAYAYASNASSALHTGGGSWGVQGGSAAAGDYAAALAGPPLDRYARCGYTNAAAAGVGLCSTSAPWAVANGFSIRLVWGHRSPDAAHRSFVGLQAGASAGMVSALESADYPTGAPGSLGVVKAAGGSEWLWAWSGASSGTVATGVPVTADTVWSLVLHCEPGGAQVEAVLTDLGSGVEVSRPFTVLPAGFLRADMCSVRNGSGTASMFLVAADAVTTLTGPLG